MKGEHMEACHMCIPNPFVVLDQLKSTFILIMTTLMRDIENRSSISYDWCDVIVGVHAWLFEILELRGRNWIENWMFWLINTFFGKIEIIFLKVSL